MRPVGRVNMSNLDSWLAHIGNPVGWLTGSHAGYKAGAKSEHVRNDARATLPVPAPSVEIVERVEKRKAAKGG